MCSIKRGCEMGCGKKGAAGTFKGVGEGYEAVGGERFTRLIGIPFDGNGVM
jgi:hypothetical protein